MKRIPARVPPSFSDVELIANGLLVCGARGYHGPFLNEAIYNACPSEFWHGQGDCYLCYGTVNVARNQAAEAEAKGRAA